MTGECNRLFSCVESALSAYIHYIFLRCSQESCCVGGDGPHYRSIELSTGIPSRMDPLVAMPALFTSTSISPLTWSITKGLLEL